MHIMVVKTLADVREAVVKVLESMHQEARDLEVTYSSYNETTKTWTVFANFVTDDNNYGVMLMLDEEGNCTKYDLSKYSY